MKYAIVRVYQDPRRWRDARVVRRGLTSEAADEWIASFESSSATATSWHAKQRTKLHGPWVDYVRPMWRVE